MSETLYIRGVSAAATDTDVAVVCEIHSRTTDDLLANLLDEMRASFGAGGITVCRSCVERMKQEADRRRGVPPGEVT